MNSFNSTIVKLCFFTLLVGISCRKEDTEVDKILELSCSQSSASQYSTVMLEASADIVSFNGELTVGGVIHKAVLAERRYIAFVLSGETGLGMQTIEVQVDGQFFKITINILPLPEPADPELSVQTYITEIRAVKDLSMVAMDSVYKRLNRAPDAAYNSMQTELLATEDSLNKYMQRFNALNAEDRKVAAGMLEASKLRMAPVNAFLTEYHNMVIAGKLMKRNLSVCDIPGNPSEAWECVLNEARRNLRLILIDAIAYAAVGGLTGSVVPVLGTAAGIQVGFGLSLVFNFKHIIYFKTTLINNFSAAFQVTADYLKSGQASAPIEFVNDQDKVIDIQIERRNLNRNDLNSAYGFVASYLSTAVEFTDFMRTYCKAFITSVPDFQAPYLVQKPLTELSFISVEVSDNPNVQLVSLSGTAEKPLLRFKSNAGDDQYFQYQVKYDDGVFKHQSNYNGYLKNEVSMTLNDTILSADDHHIYVDVKAPAGQNWNITYNTDWMIVTPYNGSGNARVQVNLQDNKLNFTDRSDYVRLNCMGRVVSAKITQNWKGCSDLKVTLTANGKVLKASATGGRTPYEYRFIGPYAGSYSSSDTHTPEFAGSKRVVVRDANGCTDTSETLCLDDIVINSVNTTKDQYNNGTFTFRYSSQLGLRPFWESVPFNSQKQTYLISYTNAPHYADYFSLNSFCTQGSFTLRTSYVNLSGTAGDRTMTISFVEMTGYTMKIRLWAGCYGTYGCPGSDGNTFTNEYAASW